VADIESPVIEFPCAYPIKIIGDVTDDAVNTILDVVRRHAPEVTPDVVSTRKSSKGNFHSIRVTIVATGEPQLKALHEELMILDSVRMVL